MTTVGRASSNAFGGVIFRYAWVRSGTAVFRNGAASIGRRGLPSSRLMKRQRIPSASDWRSPSRVPQGPEARRHPWISRGRPSSAPLRATALGLARTCQRVPPGDNETRYRRTTPEGSRGFGRHPRLVAQCPQPSTVDLGLRIAPLAIMGKCGPAKHASGAPRASSPLGAHRPEPNGGSYRGDPENCPRARQVAPAEQVGRGVGDQPYCETWVILDHIVRIWRDFEMSSCGISQSCSTICAF